MNPLVTWNAKNPRSQRTKRTTKMVQSMLPPFPGKVRGRARATAILRESSQLDAAFGRGSRFQVPDSKENRAIWNLEFGIWESEVRPKALAPAALKAAGAVPGIAGGLPHVLPVHFAGSQLVGPFPGQLGLDILELDRVLPETDGAAPPESVTRLVILVGTPRLIVGAPLEVLPPVIALRDFVQVFSGPSPPVPIDSPRSIPRPVAVPDAISTNEFRLSPVEAIVSASSSATASVAMPRRRVSSESCGAGLRRGASP